MAHNTRGGKRLQYTWLGTSLADPSLASGAKLTALVFAAAEAETIIRIRGELVVVMESPTAADQLIFGFGLRVAAKGTAAAGSTIGPVSDASADWMGYRVVPLQATGGADIAESARITIDVRAMRKIKLNEELIMVAENLALFGTETLEWTVALRVLIGQ